MDTASAVLHQEPKPLSGIKPAVPSDLEKLINRCLRKDPAKRFQHMDDVKVALDELRESSESGKPADAPQVSKGHRSLVWPLVITASAVCLGVIAWIWLRSSRPAAPEILMTTHPLFTPLGGVGNPTFSPEGDRIAFGWSGEKQDNADIWVKLIGPGNPQRLTTDPAGDFCPAWSPDGKYIGFLRGEESGIGVFIIPALGGKERRLAQISGPEGATPLNLTWAKDNRWLVATDQNGAGQPYGLHLISVETGEKRRLTSPPKANLFGGDGDASFSPDGRSLAFVRSLGFGSRDIYRISLSDDYQPGGEPERLTYENRDIYSPVWTRDGSQILYSSGSWYTTGRAVRRISLSEPKGKSGYPATQESFGEDAWGLAISPAGGRLAYVRAYTDNNIYRIELHDKKGKVGAPQKFIASTRADMIPEYSPDGKNIAFTSCRSGSEEVWVCDADGSNPRQLTFFGGPLVGDARWSPDGKTLVFQALAEGSMDLYLISADGGRVKRITSDPGYEGQARWSRDGKWIYFHSDRTGRHEVYRMPAGEGEAVQVTRNGGLYAFESSDRKLVYYSKETPKGVAIWKVPFGGGEESQFDPGPLAGEFFNFAVVDDGIYFTKYDGILAFHEIRSGNTRAISKVDKPWDYGIAISPDQRWMLCTLGEEGTTDLILVEPFR